LFGLAFAAEPGPRLVVVNALLVPLDGSERAPFRGHMIVDASGRIAAIAPGDAPAAVLSSTPVLDVGGKVVLPGFISGHSHLSQSVTRGRAAGSWVTEWGRGGAAGGARMPEPGETHDAVLHGSVDMLIGGVTTTYNYASMGREYASLTETLDGVLDSGGRFVFGTTLPRWHEEYSREQLVEMFRTFLAHVKTVPGHERILKVSIASMAMRWGEDASRFEFELLKAFPELQLDMQMHFLEPPPNVPRTYYERSNFAWLEKYGILGHNLTFAHFIHPTEEILAKAAAAKVCMIWNPLSNGRLGSGLSDIPRYRQLGITVGMGIDGQASADISDPFQNMRVGLYGLRMQHANATVMSPREILHLHTIETAKAIRVEKDVGSLEPGKYADFIVVDPEDPDTGPVYDLYATLVLACSRANITDVYIAGRPVIRAREFLPFDLKQFQRNTRYRLQRAAAAAPRPTASN
ncbi:MAG: amidohydrolase family protein, partial [Verrucomicrobiota bacterium]